MNHVINQSETPGEKSVDEYLSSIDKILQAPKISFSGLMQEFSEVFHQIELLEEDQPELALQLATEVRNTLQGIINKIINK